MPDRTWQVDSEGRCTQVSETWSSQVGRSVDSLHGDGWLEIVHPEDRVRIKREGATLRATRQSFLQFYRIRLAAGVYMHARVLVHPMRRGGDIAGFLCVVAECRPSIRFGNPLIASIVRPPPLVVSTTTIAEDDRSFQRVAAAVE
jgi:PAS domain S-box-containing protein